MYIAAVRRLYRTHVRAVARRNGRVHAAHVDTRPVERAALRGDNGPAHEPAHAGRNRRGPVAVASARLRRAMVPLSPSDGRVPAGEARGTARRLGGGTALPRVRVVWRSAVVASSIPTLHPRRHH